MCKKKKIAAPLHLSTCHYRGPIVAREGKGNGKRRISVMSSNALKQAQYSE